MSSAPGQQAAASGKWSCRVLGWILSPAPATSALEQPHHTNCLLGSHSPLWGKRKSPTLAACLALSLFYPAASTTKHLLRPRVHRLKPSVNLRSPEPKL